MLGTKFGNSFEGSNVNKGLIVPIKALNCSSYFPDTHALVRFLKEESMAIVPVNCLKDKQELQYAGAQLASCEY